MPTVTRRLTAAPQNRKKHVVRRNGKIVRVYYTDTSGNYSKKDTIKGKDPNAHLKEKKAPKKIALTSGMIKDFKNKGMEYVVKKYGSKVTGAVRSALKHYYHGGKRNEGQSTLNAPPTAKDGYVARAGRFRDGGPVDSSMAGPDMGFKRKYALNLENDSELAQGQHHAYAQATSISSLITGQLRQAANAPLDYWETWAQDKGGQTQINKRDSSSFGIDPVYSPGSMEAQTADEEVFTPGTGKMTSLATTNNMGAFGTNMVMDPEYSTDQEHDGGDAHAGETPEEHAAHMEASLNAGASYNPWSEGEGGQYNITGPDPAKITQGTMEAMALANSYFAPQRMELAYELGDMETDMRRLAVNLGRQVDDPILQAKLYKEGMRAVRTLDTQQNTFAFQMAEQRRKEEVANYQFYDSLAQQEYNLRKQNEQFLGRLDLDKAYFDLKEKEFEYMRLKDSPPTPNTSTVDNTVPVGGDKAPGATPTAPKIPAKGTPEYDAYIKSISSAVPAPMPGAGNITGLK